MKLLMYWVIGMAVIMAFICILKLIVDFNLFLYVFWLLVLSPIAMIIGVVMTEHVQWKLRKKRNGK